jgi:hypothetical protein
MGEVSTMSEVSTVYLVAQSMLPAGITDSQCWPVTLAIRSKSES